jgi:opacity protein-like surface antigen
MKIKSIIILLSLFSLLSAQDKQAFFIGANVNFPYDIPAADPGVSFAMGYSLFTELEDVGTLNFNFVINNLRYSRTENRNLLDTANNVLIQGAEIVKNFNFFTFGLEGLYQYEFIDGLSLDAGASLNFTLSAQVEDVIDEVDFSSTSNINNSNSAVFAGLMGLSYKFDDEIYIRAVYNYTFTNLIDISSSAGTVDYHVHSARFFVSMLF